MNTDLARCFCGGFGRRYQTDAGTYIICGLRGCFRRGSGIYRDPLDAERAWNRLQAEAQDRHPSSALRPPASTAP
jgi:hypothetical protein